MLLLRCDVQVIARRVDCCDGLSALALWCSSSGIYRAGLYLPAYLASYVLMRPSHLYYRMDVLRPTLVDLAHMVNASYIVSLLVRDSSRNMITFQLRLTLAPGIICTARARKVVILYSALSVLPIL